MELNDALAAAAVAGATQLGRALRRRRRIVGWSRRPGSDTPMWNAFAAQLRRALSHYGAKARLARYLGLPRQRISEFVTQRVRLPDAEITLRLLHWLGENSAGRDPSR